MTFIERIRRLLPGIWFGLLTAIAFVATPAAFAALDVSQAGLVVRKIFEWEAGLSLAFGLLVLVIERRAGLARHRESGSSQFSVEMMLALGALFCTVAGYYGVQPAMQAARAGASSVLTFGQLHALSTAFFGAKGLLVLALAWKATR